MAKRKQRRNKRQSKPEMRVLTLSDVILAQQVADQAQREAALLQRTFETQLNAMQDAIAILKPKRRKKRAAWGSKKRAAVTIVKTVRKVAPRRKADRVQNTATVKVAAPKRKAKAKSKPKPKPVNAFKS